MTMKFIQEQRNILVNASEVKPTSSASKIRKAFTIGAVATAIGYAGVNVNSKPQVIPSPVSSPLPSHVITIKHPKRVKLPIKKINKPNKPVVTVTPSTIIIQTPQLLKIREIFINKSEMEKKLLSKSVSGGEIKFEQDKIRIRGRYNVIGPINVPFNMLAHFVRNSNAIGLQIDQLSIAGESASRERQTQAQSKLNSLIKLDLKDKQINLMIVENKKIIHYKEFK